MHNRPQATQAENLRCAAFEQIGLQIPLAKAEQILAGNVKLANRLGRRPTRWVMHQHVIPAIIETLGAERIEQARHQSGERLLELMNAAVKDAGYTIRPGGERYMAHQLLNSKRRGLVPRTSAIWLLTAAGIALHKAWSLLAAGIAPAAIPAALASGQTGADGGLSPALRCTAILLALFAAEAMTQKREHEICSSYDRTPSRCGFSRYAGRASVVAGGIGAGFYESVLATEAMAASVPMQTLFLAAVITAITYGSGRILASYDLADVP